jgi:hypothetical protein
MNSESEKSLLTFNKSMIFWTGQIIRDNNEREYKVCNEIFYDSGKIKQRMVLKSLYFKSDINKAKSSFVKNRLEWLGLIK